MTDDELKELVALLGEAASLIEEQAQESERKTGNADVLRMGVVAGLKRTAVTFKAQINVESE